MRIYLKRFLLIGFTLLFFIQGGTSAFAQESTNPLVEPSEITAYAETGDNMINILLLGIDFGSSGYWGSGWKSSIEDCHTDAVMVVAINLDQKSVELVSLPRDTVTYVPGVKGIYKLNAAVNCAKTFQEGLLRTKSAAEWLLGNIYIDYYFAVDMNTMIALGDAIGGVDVDLEMSYKGHSGTWYNAGLQHLDGTGIMDYMRARTNATVNYNDIGRTNRQRQMILAISDKLINDEAMLWSVFNTAIELSEGFYTDITSMDILKLAAMLPVFLEADESGIDTYVLTGPYKGTLEWNFTFTDQENRLSVLDTVYGVSAEPIPYVSTEYAQWLLDTGFSSVHYISVAQEFQQALQTYDLKKLSDSQKDAYTSFTLAYQDAVTTFETAANTLLATDTGAMEKARHTLKEAGDACAAALDYSHNLPWAHNRKYWYEDSYINEYQLNWN